MISSNINTNTNMLRGPVVATFLRYSVPWALAMLLMSSAGVVDGFFIGRHAGPLALAALNIIAPVYSLIMGLGIVLASGGGVRCAHYRGGQREDMARAMFTKTMAALLVVGLAVAAGCLLGLESIVRFLGADAELAPIATEYLRIVVPFFPVIVLEMGLAYFVRVDERPALASLGLMGSAIINIALDYLFIAHWGWGVRGAAWATGIGYSATLALLVGAHLIWNSRPHLRLTRRWGNWDELLQAAWNGSSEMINEFSSGIVMLLINIIMMRRVGPYGVAAFTVINYINWFCLMLAYGVSDSLAPLVSANFGAGRLDRVRAFLGTAAVSVGGLGMACFLAVSLWPHALVGVFLPSEDRVAMLAMDFMHVARFMFLFCGLNIVLTAYFTGMLRVGASAAVAALRSLILPAALLTILPPLIGDMGVFMALPLAEIITLAAALWLYGAARPARAS